ncbi:MAG: cytochrome c nitrite reductase small subunit [candidate division Zixibacteria bacterium]|nr:cytochrome c nitrite reductase small subunit [candidate division Zixibacteria bacterium]
MTQTPDSRSNTAVSKWLLAIVIVAGLFFGIGFYTFYYAKGGSYLSDDPNVCINCHIMREQFDSWQKGSHHGVAVCNDCHLPPSFPGRYIVKAENGFNHSRKFTFQDFHEPIAIRPANREVLQQNCLRCHAQLISESVGTFTHADDHQNCVRCHREVGHGAAH